MEYQGQPGQIMFIAILSVALAGIFGAFVGYLIWGPGVARYSVMSQSNEATRTVTVDRLSVTFPSGVICRRGEVSTRNITINNLDERTRYASVSLSLVRSSGVDSATISNLSGNTYGVTLAAHGAITYQLYMNPSAEGYAIFDIRVNGELLGSITLYVVP